MLMETVAAAELHPSCELHLDPNGVGVGLGAMNLDILQNDYIAIARHFQRRWRVAPLT
jgi:hypothetical protein